MKKSKFYVVFILIFSLSACDKIEHVKEFPKLKLDYEEAQKRIDELEERNAELESRLKKQKPDLQTQTRDSKQVKTLKMLLTSEE